MGAFRPCKAEQPHEICHFESMNQMEIVLAGLRFLGSGALVPSVDRGLRKQGSFHPSSRRSLYGALRRTDIKITE